MATLSKHPNIVSLIEVIDDPQKQQSQLLMEYVDGGTVYREEDIGNK